MLMSTSVKKKQFKLLDETNVGRITADFSLQFTKFLVKTFYISRPTPKKKDYNT